ncbi:MAG: hypothetical protein AB7G28_25150 [Pirellulales bacterium]
MDIHGPTESDGREAIAELRKLAALMADCHGEPNGFCRESANKIQECVGREWASLVEFPDWGPMIQVADTDVELVNLLQTIGNRMSMIARREWMRDGVEYPDLGTRPNLRDVPKADDVNHLADRLSLRLGLHDQSDRSRIELRPNQIEIINALRSIGRPVRGEEFLHELNAKGLPASSATKQQFAFLVQIGELVQGKDGYGLPEWSSES